MKVLINVLGRNIDLPRVVMGLKAREVKYDKKIYKEIKDEFG